MFLKLLHPSLQRSPWLQPSRGCQLLRLLAWKVAGESETWRGKDHCQVKLLEEDATWAAPWQHWAWGPAFPWGGKVIQNRTATCSFQTGQAKYFLNSRKAHQSHCRHFGCPKYSKGLARAGWPQQEHWCIWVFGIWSLPLQTKPWWGGTRCEVPPHHRDKA